IYWNQGFYPEEDQALEQVITEWEAETGIQVQLSFYSSDDILNQTAIALESGNPPDIVFSHRADFTLQPRWAWEGKLVDVSDVIEPVKNLYSPTALEAAYLYNKAENKRSYYGVPIHQQTIHIHYWRDLLSQAGVDETDIPSNWDDFWAFWKQTQDKLHQTGETEIYGLGLPLSIKASDTYYQFEQILDAYDVDLLDETGQLQLNDPQVRQGLIEALDWMTQFYQGGYVPTEAVNWLDSDNNINFLNRNTLMTTNPSLSIPASQRDDDDLYLKQIATREFPNEPDGEPISYLVTIKQALIFATERNPQAAKDFLAYFVQPERLGTYVKGSLGRWFPTMPSSLEDPFWKESKDPHVSIAVRQFRQRPTRPFYHALSPAYSQVQAENIWGQAIDAVIAKGVSPEEAVDQAIIDIYRIFAKWERE
nr:ABC transporter substrate-binding protein [Leptolyngbyaceae cyanobacterium MO_188.B28]